MKNYILFLCALLTIGFASSCKSPTDYDADRWSDKDTTAKPAQAELTGEWFLESYEQSGSPMQYVANGQTYSLNFKDSKNVAGKANCNTFTGTYQADSLISMTAKVSFKNLSSTKMNCNIVDLGDKYLSMLGSSLKLAVQYYSSGQRLEISYFDAVTGNMYSMFFNRKQTPNTNVDLLKGSEWTLVSFEQFGQAAEWIPVAFQEKLFISFLEDSKASGMSECTGFTAKYVTDDTPLAGTQDYPLTITMTNHVNCNGNYGNRFLDALKATKSYFQMGDSLEMTYNIGQGGTVSRMMFVRKGTTWNPQDSLTSTQTTLVNDLPTANIPADPFKITQKYPIVNNILNLGVEFGGGCALHEFEMFGKVSTGGIELLLTHDANNDLCNALINTEATFDLTKFVEEYKKITGKTNGQITMVMKSTGNTGVHAFQFQF
ncbi:MAG: META domain-containing protein [Bacteroidota bacterium]